MTVAKPRLAAALADCGGAGQIIAAISFGSCWTGELDSPDHRSHVTHARIIPGTDGQPHCPATHPYIIPDLTQQAAYTVTADDGAIYFSSDKMNGMDLPGGTTFHADYIPGWEAITRATWHRNCLDRLLNCSDGELGDGTMLKRGGLSYIASPRLVPAPIRAS